MAAKHAETDGSGIGQVLHEGNGSRLGGSCSNAEASTSSKQRSGGTAGDSGSPDEVQCSSRWRSAVSSARSLCSLQRLTFCCAAAAVCLGLAALFHRLYGWQFIEVKVFLNS